MGIAVIGGLLTSLFLTLAVVPATYDLFDDLKLRLFRKKNKTVAGNSYAGQLSSTHPALL